MNVDLHPSESVYLNMKKLVFGCVLLAQSFAFGQKVIPFVDYNNWMRTVENGDFKYIELQEVKEYQGGDNLVAYLDIRGNLRVYDGQTRHDISNMNLKYKISDNILAWNVGTTLGIWENGTKKYPSFFAGDYIVKDSLVAYVDTRYNTIQVYWKGKEYPIQASTQDVVLNNSPKIGENVVAYADNGGLFRIFYNGKLFDVGVWNGDINLQSGTDVVAFNDPNTRTFAAFDKGDFIDLDMQWAKKYKAGRGLIVFEDANGNLKKYEKGEVKDLCSFPGEWDVIDDIIWYENNGFSYVHYKGKTVMAANYQVKEVLLKNGTAVFRNMLGGVSAVIQGEVVELTNMPNANFEIYGNSVLVKLPNHSFLIYTNGKILRA